MGEKPPQIFRDADGRRILFGLRFDTDDAERERLKDLIESYGGQVVGFSALPKTGYLLVDTTTADGRQQSAARHSPPRCYVVHYSWAELCIRAGRLLPPLLHPPVFVVDGLPVKIHLHQSLSHDVAEHVNDMVQDFGGDPTAALEEADIIVASERHVSYRTLLKRFRHAVKTPLWILGAVKKRRPLVVLPDEPAEPAKVSQPARPAPAAPLVAEEVGDASSIKVPDFMLLLTSDSVKRPVVRFTPAEDLAFVRYLSNLDLLISGSLSGNKLYQNMCAENEWAREHTWQSWRQRYMRNKATYAKLIVEQAQRTYAALPPPRKREIQERYKMRKELDRERSKRRQEQDLRDEFGLDQFIKDPPEDEAEDMRGLWAEQMPEDDEPVAPRRRPQHQQQRKRVVVSDEEIGGDGEEEEEEEDPFANEPVVQDNDADFQASYVASMNNVDYSINEDEDEPAPPIIENELPVRAASRPPSLPATRAPTPTLQVAHTSYNASQRMPPPAQPASHAVPLKWQPVRSARDYAAPQPPPPPPPPPPEAGPSRRPAPAPLPASRRNSMTEVERALLSDSEYETPTGNDRRKRRKGSISSDDEDARLLLQHNALIAAANQPAPKKQRPAPLPAPPHEQSSSSRQLRPRPGSAAPARAQPGRAASAKTAPVLVPILQAESTTSGDDGAFRPPRNTRARAVREAQTPFTPLPNTRAAQVASSRGTGG